jgi:hypothetical protein
MLAIRSSVGSCEAIPVSVECIPLSGRQGGRIREKAGEGGRRREKAGEGGRRRENSAKPYSGGRSRSSFIKNSFVLSFIRRLNF